MRYKTNNAGKHIVDFNTSTLASGVYVYRIEAGSITIGGANWFFQLFGIPGQRSVYFVTSTGYSAGGNIY